VTALLTGLVVPLVAVAQWLFASRGKRVLDTLKD